MIKKMLVIGVVVSFLCTSFLSFAALANNKKTARKYFKAGLVLVEKKEFEKAAEQFNRSVELYPTKNALYNLANCYKVLYQYGEALIAIDKLKRLFKNDFDKEWINELETLEAKLKSSMVKLEIQVDVKDATVTVNGDTVGTSPMAEPVVLSPGKHKVEIVHNDYETIERELDLQAGAHHVESFELAPPEETVVVEPEAVQEETDIEEHEKPRRLWTWVSYGAGGAFAISTIITGSVVLSKKIKLDDMRDSCIGDNCESEFYAKKKDAKKIGIVTNVTAGIAAAGLVLGTVFYFMEDKWFNNKETNVVFAPVISPNGGGFAVGGKF